MTNRGITAAVAAYGCWGFLPIFWKLLEEVPAPEILCHRMIWSLFLTMACIVTLGKLQIILQHLRCWRTVLRITVSASLLAVNWLIYIWAVNSGHIVETSLGYFINPLVAVAMAVIILGESLRFGQYFALLFAIAGVIYLTFSYGQFPWIALSLAITFALYGLLHKTTSLPALEGLALETLPLFLPAAAYLFFLDQVGDAAFLRDGLSPSVLLILTGAATSVPLLLFGFAAKNIPFSVLGLLQYIAPSINFFIGIFMYHEPFPPERLIGFILVWTALAIYLLENWMQRKRQETHGIQATANPRV